MIIGLSGKMGVGKDYIARNIIQPFIESRFPKERCLNLAFADQLKINTIMHYQVPFESVFIKKNNESRSLLQREGTENGRNKYGQDIWIHYTQNWIDVWKSRGFTTFLISDVRFCNEIDWIHKQDGVVIRIEAPNRSKIKYEQEFGHIEQEFGHIEQEFGHIEQEFGHIEHTHQSETELDLVHSSKYDLVVNNDIDNTNLIYNFISNLFN